ncbi:MAG TPA: hypothetical protein VFF49_04975 [Thermodesulfobacteriota bacterium]|nr:hypothetical protein [Thermodesulfobacteriota bacterium]
MIRHLGFLAALIVGAFLLTNTLSLAGEAVGGKKMTITGRVVDPACYIHMGLKGESHKQCATACAKAGQAFGILDEKAGVLYQVLEGAIATDPNKLLWGHEEEIVTVKGIVFHKDGMHAIVAQEVTKGS